MKFPWHCCWMAMSLEYLSRPISSVCEISYFRTTKVEVLWLIFTCNDFFFYSGIWWVVAWLTTITREDLHIRRRHQLLLLPPTLEQVWTWIQIPCCLPSTAQLVTFQNGLNPPKFLYKMWFHDFFQKKFSCIDCVHMFANTIQNVSNCSMHKYDQLVWRIFLNLIFSKILLFGPTVLLWGVNLTSRILLLWWTFQNFIVNYISSTYWYILLEKMMITSSSVCRH